MQELTLVVGIHDVDGKIKVSIKPNVPISRRIYGIIKPFIKDYVKLLNKYRLYVDSEGKWKLLQSIVDPNDTHIVIYDIYKLTLHLDTHLPK
jgi:hypothetical protein